MAAELISVKRLPSKGKPGSWYYDNQEKVFYVALPDGTLLDVQGMFTQNPRGIVGPQGEPGPAGTPGRDSTVPGPAGRNGADSTAVGPQGPRGPRGTAGSHGQNGKDSTVSGPAGKDGQSIVGPAGPKGDKGEPGSIVYPSDSQLAATNKLLLDQKARAHAAFLQAMLDVAKIKNRSTAKHIELFLNRVKHEAGL